MEGVSLSESVAVRLGEIFRRNGYIRRASEERRQEEGSSYKKGTELRLVANDATELELIYILLHAAGFKPGRPFRHLKQTRVPIYGQKDVERFLALIEGRSTSEEQFKGTVASRPRGRPRNQRPPAPAPPVVQSSRPSTSARFRGCLLGLACGDALGAPVESRPWRSFPAVTEMTGGGLLDLPPGSWTEETSMALCLAASLTERGGFDAADQMARYCRWQSYGYMSSLAHCVDIGKAMSAALSRYRLSGNPFSGNTNPRSAGNACLARLAPVPMYCFPDVEAAATWAAESARTTHGALDCLECARLLAAMLCAALAGKDREEILFSHDPARFSSPRVRALALGEYRDKKVRMIQGTIRATECLEAALWCFVHAGSLREAVLRAVNLGHDADATGAICGQLAGAHWGEEAIPPGWLERLVRRDEISRLADRLGLRSQPAGSGARKRRDGSAAD